VKQSDCYGVDLNQEPLERASTVGIRVFQVSLEDEKLPFKDGFFDIVVSGETIEHLIRTDHFLSEINRVLDAKGKFVLSFPNISQPVSLLIMAVLDLPPQYSARYRAPHVRDFTLRSIKSALRSNGLNPSAVEGTFVYPFRNPLSRFLARHIPRWGNQIIVVADKVGRPQDVPPIEWDSSKL
jgi:SAM-dependent methyltransferase